MKSSCVCFATRKCDHIVCMVLLLLLCRYYWYTAAADLGPHPHRPREEDQNLHRHHQGSKQVSLYPDCDQPISFCRLPQKESFIWKHAMSVVSCSTFTLFLILTSEIVSRCSPSPVLLPGLLVVSPCLCSILL